MQRIQNKMQRNCVLTITIKSSTIILPQTIPIPPSLLLPTVHSLLDTKSLQGNYCLLMTIPRGQFVPFQHLLCFLHHSITFLIAISHVVLSRTISSLGTLQIPMYGLSIILLHTNSLIETKAYIILCGDMSPFGS